MSGAGSWPSIPLSFSTRPIRGWRITSAVGSTTGYTTFGALRTSMSIRHAWGANSQPASSLPWTIYREFRQAIQASDKHSSRIASNREGLLKGAEEKFKLQVIDEQERLEIIEIVEAADFNAFQPFIYIIPFSEVRNQAKPVGIAERASPTSIEFRIEDLRESQFHLIPICADEDSSAAPAHKRRRAVALALHCTDRFRSKQLGITSETDW